ncbi:MAG: hypothetical protein JW724_03220 [Candidatus Altiarchaeota archaeon]|nr:hypothetical protein [Candidatus Altiarchaeota archaeon]
MAAIDWPTAWKEMGHLGDIITRFGDNQNRGRISVIFDRHRTAHLHIHKDDEWFSTQEFRVGERGGESPRVRAALMLLALAIRADNEDHQQDRR